LNYLSRAADNFCMGTDPIRTSIDLPRELHRRLHEAAARKGCSARKLILSGIERAVEDEAPVRPRRRLLWADAWLLALSHAAGGALVTFNKALGSRGAYCLLAK
jgi:hypothetical protein